MLSKVQSNWNCGPDCTMRSNHLSLDPLAPGRLTTRDTTQLYQSDEKMGRQGKNTFNTTKSSTIPTKTSGSTKAILEHANIDEAEENDLK